MTDITNTRLLYLKGFLFLLTGCLAAGILLIQYPDLQVAILLIVSVWCFARFYYFAFYVIEHYIDAQYRFAGLGAFIAYLWSRRQNR